MIMCVYCLSVFLFSQRGKTGTCIDFRMIRLLMSAVLFFRRRFPQYVVALACPVQSSRDLILIRRLLFFQPAFAADLSVLCPQE